MVAHKRCDPCVGQRASVDDWTIELCASDGSCVDARSASCGDRRIGLLVADRLPGRIATAQSALPLASAICADLLAGLSCAAGKSVTGMFVAVAGPPLGVDVGGTTARASSSRRHASRAVAADAPALVRIAAACHEAEAVDTSRSRIGHRAR